MTRWLLLVILLAGCLPKLAPAPDMGPARDTGQDTALDLASGDADAAAADPCGVLASEAVRWDFRSGENPLESVVGDVELTSRQGEAVFDEYGLRTGKEQIVETTDDALQGVLEAAEDGLTMESWFYLATEQPTNTTESSERRIMSWALDTTERNFSLYWLLMDRSLSAAVRTAEDSDGSAVPAGTLERERLVHVVVSIGDDGTKIFVDGEERTSVAVGSEISGWADGFPLVIGGEAVTPDSTQRDDREVAATFRLVGLHTDAMDEDEAANLFACRQQQSKELTCDEEGLETWCDRLRTDEMVRWDFSADSPFQNAACGSDSNDPVLTQLLADQDSPSVESGELRTDGTDGVFGADEGTLTFLTEPIQSSEAVTLEAWFKADSDQAVSEVPQRRILTWSRNSDKRNISLLWSEVSPGPGARIEARVRYPAMDNLGANGTPAIETVEQYVPDRWYHALLTSGPGGTQVFIDGEPAELALGGEMDIQVNRVPDTGDSFRYGFPFLVGDEADDDTTPQMDSRPFSGAFREVALHTRTFNEAEARALAECRGVTFE